MRIHLLACVLALPLLALPSRALAWGDKGPPVIIDAGINFRFNVYCNDGKGGCQKAPWYLYWPVGADLQARAQPSYPNWPAQGQPPAPPSGAPNMPRSAPTLPAPGNAPAVGPQVAPTSYPAPTAVQPVGYTYRAAPGYWYSR